MNPDWSTHGTYQLLRDDCGIAVRHGGWTLMLPPGPLIEAFLAAYSAIQAQEPSLSPAAVLELLWPSLEEWAIRDN